jgi:8-oxo-dGTP pyrophosphatase MutT (NUDIX family)
MPSTKRVNSVSVVLYNIRKKKVLLVLRADGGGWEPITGGIDQGENVVDTAAREVFEEIGFEIERKNLIFTKKYYLKDGSWVKTFFCSIEDVEISKLTPQKTEVQKIEYFSIEELVNLRIKEEKRMYGEIYIEFGAFHRAYRAVLCAVNGLNFPKENPSLLSPFIDNKLIVWEPV